MQKIIASDFMRQSKMLLLFAFATFMGIYTFEYSLKAQYASDLVLEGILAKSMLNEVLRMSAFLLFGGLIAKRAVKNLADVSFFSTLWSIGKAMVTFMFTMIVVLMIVGITAPELQPGQKLEDLVISEFQYFLLLAGVALVVSTALVAFVQHVYNSGVRKNCKSAGISAKSFPLYKNDYAIPFRSILMLVEQPMALALGVAYILLSAFTVFLSREDIAFLTVIINAVKMTLLMFGAGVMIRVLIQRAVDGQEGEVK